MGKDILLGFFKKHKLSYLVGIAFMLLSSWVQTLFPQVLGSTVDILKTEHFSARPIYGNLLRLLLIAAGTFAFTFIWRNLVIANARRLECDLREKLFDHFQRLSPEFYNSRKTGDLIAYAINDINAVRMTFGPATSMAVNGIVVCVISVWSMAQAVSWPLTLLSLFPVPLIVYIMGRIGREVKKRFRRVQETFSAISDRVSENINGIRVIKAYVQEDAEVDKFEQLNRRMQASNLDMVKVSAFLSPLIEICFTASFVLNLIWGGRMVLAGGISLGDFVAFNGYLAMILAPVLSIGQVINNFQRGFASFGRLNEIFSVRPAVGDEGKTDVFPQGALAVRGLTFSYPGAGRPALQKISLVVPKGHTLGIIGKTGSGKSTLIHLLLRHYAVGRGRIFFGGADADDLTLRALRGGFGVVPQDTFLFGASVYDNIKFFNDAYTDGQAEQAARAACIYDSILELPQGFHTILGERGVNLSGGQKQRIAIARALIRDPEILVLDDSLSAVDTVTEARILQNLRALRQNRTTIIIAHRISAVMESDEIVVLDRGAVAERGTHADLMEKGGLYHDICRYQTGEEADKASRVS